MTLEEISAVAGAKTKGRKLVAKCPCHDDNDPSVELKEGDTGVLVICRAGCKTEDVVGAWGLKMSDLFEKQERNGEPPIYYTYTDKAGNPTIRKVRKPPKRFFIERLEDSAWVNGKGDYQPELYNIVQVLDAVRNKKTVWVVEGEKDADAVNRKGVVATTNFDGAGKWHQRYTDSLAGANVVVVADKDEPGLKHAEAIKRNLSGVCNVKLVEAKEGKDAYDHFAKGYGLRDFVPIVEKKERLYDLLAVKRLSDVQPEYARFIHEPYIRFGTTNLYDARGGSGKTTTMLGYCATASRGYTPENEQIEPFNMLYFGKEDSAGELRAKYDEIGGDPARFIVYDKPFALDERGREMARQLIADFEAKMVVCDPIKVYLPYMSNQYDESVLGPHLAAIRDEVARPMDVAWVNVRHFAKIRGGVSYDDLSEAGQGNEAWRDTHRSQLVGLPLPKPKYGCAIFHMKGSIMTPTGSPFGWEFQRGQFCWISPEHLDLSWLKGYNNPGRPSEKRQGAERFLKANMVGGVPMERDYLIERGIAEGHSERTLYRAADALGIDKQEGGKWVLPDPYGEGK